MGPASARFLHVSAFKTESDQTPLRCPQHRRASAQPVAWGPPPVRIPSGPPRGTQSLAPTRSSCLGLGAGDAGRSGTPWRALQNPRPPCLPSPSSRAPHFEFRAAHAGHGLGARGVAVGWSHGSRRRGSGLKRARTNGQGGSSSARVLGVRPSQTAARREMYTRNSFPGSNRAGTTPPRPRLPQLPPPPLLLLPPVAANAVGREGRYAGVALRPRTTQRRAGREKGEETKRERRRERERERETGSRPQSMKGPHPRGTLARHPPPLRPLHRRYEYTRARTARARYEEVRGRTRLS